MSRTLVFIVDSILDGLNNAFFHQLTGLFFSHFIQFMLAVLILVMVNTERKRTHSKEFVYLTLGFMLLMFQQYLNSTILGLRVIAQLAPVEQYSVLLDRVLELFALIILTTAFLYPVAKRKLVLQRIMAYNLLCAVVISLSVFLSFYFQGAGAPFATHWGAWLLAGLNLALLLAIIFYTLLAGWKSAPLIVAAASLWALTEVFTLRNDLLFGGRDSTLLMLSETAPILVYALLVLAIFRQISREYMRLHTATLKSKQQLQAMFDGITDGIVTLDKRLKVLNVNQSERGFLGLRPEAVINTTCHELYGRGEKPCPECPALATLESGKKSAAAFHTSRKTGEEPSFFEEEAFPLFSQPGKVEQVIVYIKNTTDRHRIEERMRSLDRLAAVGEMSTRIAHEIRNPLEAIRGSAEYLGQTVDSDLVREFTRIIRDESERLSNLTRNLLNYATQIQLNPKLSNINYLVMDTKKLLKTEFDEAQAKLRMWLDRDIPDTVFDPGLIKQVLINLMINALEAAKPPGAMVLGTRWRRAGSQTKQNPEQESMVDEFLQSGGAHHFVGDDDVKNREHIAFYCRDFGKGIGEENIESIFNPFVTNKAKGSGLGLATSERIVSEHNGMIEVYSILGKGTLFVVRLPCRRDVNSHG